MTPDSQRPLDSLGDESPAHIAARRLAVARPFYRRLGRTGLEVSAFGLGGGAGIASPDVLHAYDKGVNLFFYSTDLHQFLYRGMAGALRRLFGRSSAQRDRVVLAAVTYVNRPSMLGAILFDQFRELGLDYIDILFWGCIGTTDRRPFAECMGLTPQVRGPGTRVASYVEAMHGASDRLRRSGAVRYTGASFHSIDVAREWLDSSCLDVVMVRNNVAHRSAAAHLLSRMSGPAESRQGIITFKSTVASSGALWRAPAGLPEDCWIPRPPTLYRYALSNPAVDVCLTAWSNRTEIDAAFAELQQGPLTPDEMRYLEYYGDVHRGRLAADDVPTEGLIRRRDAPAPVDST